MKQLVCFLLLFVLQPRAWAWQVPAFPGAEGYGKWTTGGRNGKVWRVTSLADSGPGSLREALAAKGPRIVVFAVAGTIALESKLDIRNGDLTIEGQTAPGEGICIRNYTVTINADNVIVRYLRFRLGDEKKQEDDAFNGKGHANIIIDHCSMSWAVDECASFYDNRNFTLQWCMITESLAHSVHHKGPHGYGGIWGGQGASFHHNLLAHHTSRNPRFCGSRYTHQPEKEIVDFRNNVVYNWGFNSAYGGEGGNHNMVNNYFKAGPATHAKVAGRIVNPADTPYGRFYVTGNFVAGYPAITASNWAGGVQCAQPAAAYSETPVPFVPIVQQDAAEAYRLVLEGAGASYKRDAVDARIVQEVAGGGFTYGHAGIIDSQQDAGGWPVLQAAPAPADDDLDGIPDEWEQAHGLDPHNSKDATLHTLDKQYNNIEVYANALIAR